MPDSPHQQCELLSVSVVLVTFLVTCITSVKLLLHQAVQSSSVLYTLEELFCVSLAKVVNGT